jgi:hypothetical protein
MVKQSDIQHYGMDVRDLETSVFEMIEMLHLRSKIHQYFHELSDNDKNEVTRYDLILISNAQAFYEKMRTIHDFHNSNKPEDEWWWHLNKIVQAFNARSFTISFGQLNGDLMVKTV